MFFIQQISYKRGRKTCFCLHFARSSVVLVAMPMQRVSPWVWQAPIKLCKWAQISIVLAKCVILIHIFPNCLLSLLHCWTVSNVHHMSISFEITILWKCLCSVIRKGKSSSHDSFQTNAHTHIQRKVYGKTKYNQKCKSEGASHSLFVLHFNKSFDSLYSELSAASPTNNLWWISNAWEHPIKDAILCWLTWKASVSYSWTPKIEFI